MSSKRSNLFKVGVTREEMLTKRESRNLSLRKKKIEEFIFNKRFNQESEFTPVGYQDKESDDFYQQVKKETSDDIPTLLKLIQSNEKKEVLKGVVAVRKLLSNPFQPPIEEILKSGIAEIIIAIIKNFPSHKDIPITFECLWIVTNLASGDSPAYTCELCNLGVIDTLPILFSEETPHQLYEQIIWLIANLAAEDNLKIHYEILNCNTASFLAKFLSNDKLKKWKKNSLWAISNILRKAKLRNSKDVSFFVSECVQLIKSVNLSKYHSDVTSLFTNSELVYVLSILSSLSESQETTAIIVNHQISAEIINIVKLVSNCPEFSNELNFCLRIIGNFIINSNEGTEELLQMGVVHLLHEVLLNSNSKSNIKREVCWILSNITADNEHNLSLIFNTEGLVETLFRIVNEESNDVKKEAVWCIANLTNFLNKESFTKLIKLGIVKVLNKWLTSSNFKIVVVCCEAIENLLIFTSCLSNEDDKLVINNLMLDIDNCSLKSTLEELVYNHKNNFVVSKAEKIIDYFFSDTEENMSSDDLEIFKGGEIPTDDYEVSPFNLNSNCINENLLDFDSDPFINKENISSLIDQMDNYYY